MRAIVFIRTILLVLLTGLLVSCKDKKPPMSNFSGSVNEVMVLMDRNDWNGPAGDTVKSWFKQEQRGLPQPEPVFDVINLPTASFERNIKAYRNVLYVEISPEVKKASVAFKDSPWVKTQKYFRVEAPDQQSFIEIFNAHKQHILDVFLQAEQDRLVEVYKKKPDPKISELFKTKYQLDCSFPAGYNINKDLKDFAWISRETKVDSRGIVFFQRKYENVNQFDYQRIIDVVNEELKQNIPGPLAGSYMAIDTVTPVDSKTYNFDKIHYAVMMRGLWTVVNDFMGGPFVLNIVLDEKNNRIVYMMGYVYAPDDKKRNMLRQVEAILFTTGFETSGK